MTIIGAEMNYDMNINVNVEELAHLRRVVTLAISVTGLQMERLQTFVQTLGF